MNVGDALRKAFEDEAAEVEAVGPSPEQVERALATAANRRGTAGRSGSTGVRVLPFARVARWLAVAGVAVSVAVAGLDPGAACAFRPLACELACTLPGDADEKLFLFVSAAGESLRTAD